MWMIMKQDKRMCDRVTKAMINKKKINLPSEQTNITMNIDDKRENAALRPSIKFIS